MGVRCASEKLVQSTTDMISERQVVCVRLCVLDLEIAVWKSIVPVLLLSFLERLVLALPCVILRLCGRRIVSVKRRPVVRTGRIGR